MSVLEAADFDDQSERELLQPKFYKTFTYTPQIKKDEYQKRGRIRTGIDYINTDDEDQMEIYGYTPNTAKTILTWTLIILTCGSLRLIFHWKPHWMLLCTHNRCSLENAKKVLLIDQYLTKFTENVVCISNDRLSYHQGDNPQPEGYMSVPVSNGEFERTTSIIYFENKKVRYIWEKEAKEFVRIRGLDQDINCTYFYKQKGLGAGEQKRRQIIYGLNEILVQVESYIQILFRETLTPFYVFQIFSLILWASDDYYYYAICILLISGVSLASGVIQIRRNQKQLRDTVQGIDTVMVCRGNDVYDKIESSQLVPGDIIEVPSFGCIMQCDSVLISGNVIINESMLTGESVPVTKTPLPNTSAQMIYHSKEHAKHTLFCGTKVIQTRFYNNLKVRAVVIRTGFRTAKGELVRSIMFPKPVDFKLNRHIHKLILFLSVLAIAGFTYSTILKASRQVPFGNILKKSLDLITIVVPPALPAALTIGIVYAQSRLRQSQIFCISPRSINISGCINCVCFDKTGTLTDDDLNFCELLPLRKDLCKFAKPILKPSIEMEFGPTLINLAVCHSLTLIDKQLIGDPLDQKMFASTEWILEEPDVNDTSKYDLLVPTVVKPKVDAVDREVAIMRQFPFSSSLQRMSVIARQLNASQFEVYCKGAPEMIISLCDPSSIPSDFALQLQKYTEKGYRVLGLAYRPLESMTFPKMQRAAREDMEKNLKFLGLLVMGNMLKPETTHVIKTLTKANIRTVMITGDNMLTALSVARECSMIQPMHKVILLEATESEGNPKVSWKFANTTVKLSDVDFKLSSNDRREQTHVAITGKTFKLLRDHYPELLRKVAIRGTVFARMAPDQKQQLVEMLEDLGYYVSMCGDGANDCGALKAAHAGVSLSETEASVASPFTSKVQNISCIPTLIREGRASIVTSFGILKYMACYSMAQFFSVLILYTYETNLRDLQFLYIDLPLLTLFVASFGRNHAFDRLDRTPPPSSIIGFVQLSSISLQIILAIGVQIASIMFLKFEPKYSPEESKKEDSFFENYAVFASSVFQYITLAVVFSKGKPYRAPLYKNKLFIISLVVMTICTIILVYHPMKFFEILYEFKLTQIPESFRQMMLSLAIVHFVLSIFLENFVVDFILFKKFPKHFKYMNKRPPLYRVIDEETNNNTRWLPLEEKPATNGYPANGTDKL